MQYSPAIYVAGTEYDAQGRAYPIVWKDGTAYRLTAGGNDDASAESIFVSGNTQYVAGSVNDSARLWTNSASQTLNSAVSYARSVTVANSNVYVAGERNFGAALWTNGTPQSLGGREANSVYVSGSDVYVGGTNNQDGAVIWKNGTVLHTLPGGYTVLSLYVSGNDVWACGFDGDWEWGGSARLWKNGVRQSLNNIGNAESQACSIAVLGNDVYVAGYNENPQGKYVAKLWKNGTAQNLSDGIYNAAALSVFVFRNDVYVTGYENDAQGKAQATIWKNSSVFKRLTNGNSETFSRSIFVK